MAKRAAPVSEDAIANPVIGAEPFELDGVTYYPCFTNAALAEAESHLVRQGKDVNLLLSFPPNVNYSGIRTLFAVSIHKNHADIPFEQAQDLITPSNWALFFERVQRIWARDVAPTKKKGLAQEVEEEASD